MHSSSTAGMVTATMFKDIKEITGILRNEHDGGGVNKTKQFRGDVTDNIEVVKSFCEK